MPEDLTFTEKSLLLILMAEAREVPNAVLTGKYRVKVEVKSRDKLKRQGLVTIRTESRRLYWELTDLGWKRCAEEFDAQVPAGAGARGAALYAMLATIKRYLDRADVPYDVFFQQDSDVLAPSLDEIEGTIRKTYSALARRPGGWVKLADLRERLGQFDRTEVDSVLGIMSGKPRVSIVPESNQKTLRPRDRQAAIIIGNQEKHLIAIEP